MASYLVDLFARVVLARACRTDQLPSAFGLCLSDYLCVTMRAKKNPGKPLRAAQGFSPISGEVGSR